MAGPGARRCRRPAATTRVADAENLPFDDASFDTVLSTFGVMFAPNPDRAAEEMIRCARPGGRIGLANWTPDGFIGRMFKIVGRARAASRGHPVTAGVGHRKRLAELFGDDAKVDVVRRHFVFRYTSAEQYFERSRRTTGRPSRPGCPRRGRPHVVAKPARRAGRRVQPRHRRSARGAVRVPRGRGPHRAS